MDIPIFIILLKTNIWVVLWGFFSFIHNIDTSILVYASSYVCKEVSLRCMYWIGIYVGPQG